MFGPPISGVPVPGGATHTLDHLELTTPEAVAQTYHVHKSAFEARGLGDAFKRVIGLVVQPGVEFGHTDVIHFDAVKARDLSAVLSDYPGIVFEAHSTDYQTAGNLHMLVENGFAILKVGPWLTFALREALYGLDAVADILDGHPPKGALMSEMEDVMRTAPDNWMKYYEGGEKDLWLQRHFSYSDRIRYYWPTPEAEAGVSRLMDRLAGRHIPAPVLAQYVPNATGTQPEEILVSAITNILEKYEAACSR